MSPRPSTGTATVPRVAVVLVAIAVAACGAGRPGPTTESTATTSARTVFPSAGVSPVPTTSVPSVSADRPPDAVLAAEGGDPVVGQLGSYSWGSGGSDSPWLPGAPVAVGAGEPLTVTIGRAVQVEAWTARLAAADTTDGAGAREIGAGSGRIVVDAPAAGAWTIQVSVRFVGGGSGSYAWRLEVP